MDKERKPYARYCIVRELLTMWSGDAADTGSLFRQFVITSNEFTSTVGTFQLFGLEGASAGVKDGKFATSDEDPKVLFDKDFDGVESAVKHFEELVSDAKKMRFKPITTMQILEFEDKLRHSKASD
jgi:hypothetical protein